MAVTTQPVEDHAARQIAGALAPEAQQEAAQEQAEQRGYLGGTLQPRKADKR
jgi:hypothetical protein